MQKRKKQKNQTEEGITIPGYNKNIEMKPVVVVFVDCCCLSQLLFSLCASLAANRGIVRVDRSVVIKQKSSNRSILLFFKSSGKLQLAVDETHPPVIDILIVSYTTQSKLVGVEIDHGDLCLRINHPFILMMN